MAILLNLVKSEFNLLSCDSFAHQVECLIDDGHTLYDKSCAKYNGSALT